MRPARCILKVHGLDCANEVAALRAALEGWPGISALGFDLVHGLMSVDSEPGAVDSGALVRRIAERTGLRAELVGAPEPARSSWRAWFGDSRRIATLASGLALGTGMTVDLGGGPARLAWAAYLAAIIAGVVELFPNAVRALRGRRLDMHVLMSVAILGAVALGQWDEAATVAFLFGLSETLEALSLDRARRAVRALLEVAPETAEVIREDGRTEVVAASQVRPGDRVRVRAGERIPVDGCVVAGRSGVDQKAITGESLPVLREAGDEVFAGTVNGDGGLDIVAARPWSETVLARVVERVRAAQAGHSPLERSIDRFAAAYTPVVVLLALVVMVVPPLGLMFLGKAAAWAVWFMRGLVLLVIACPCALVIGTPIAVVSALAAAARRGILIKGGQYLEAFARLRVLAFDKTGTLTRGEPDVVEVVPAGGQVGADVLRIAAALGDRGGHVLGRAIARHARRLSLDVPVAHDYEAAPGLGATGQVGSTRYHIGSHRYLDEAGVCEGDFHTSLRAAEDRVGTAVALTAQGEPLGWIRLADRPRAEAAEVLAELNSLGLETVMLTGDNVPTAAAMARELGIAEQRANLLPEDKATAIAELDARRGPTGMVGDGVNDAPALAVARVSIALGGISSGAALETADIVLMADDLRGLPWLVRHARRTLTRIRQNIALAVGVKVAVMVLAALGFANLWMAIAADLGVSLLVVANALRLLRNS
jgi:Cd2+/Zn2+-exporting ATPase